MPNRCRARSTRLAPDMTAHDAARGTLRVMHTWGTAITIDVRDPIPPEVVELTEGRTEQDGTFTRDALDRCCALIDLLEHLRMRDRSEPRVIVRVVPDEVTALRDVLQHFA